MHVKSLVLGIIILNIETLNPRIPTTKKWWGLHILIYLLLSIGAWSTGCWQQSARLSCPGISFLAVSVIAFSVWCSPQGPCQPNCSWAGISPLCPVDSISWWSLFGLCGWSIPVVFALPLLLQVFGLTSLYSWLCRMQWVILDTADEIYTYNLQHSWTLLEVINLQYHVIRRAAIKCNLGKNRIEIELSFLFFPSWRLGSPLLLP